MSIKAGRVGVNPADVDPINGKINPSTIESYTKEQSDAKYATKEALSASESSTIGLLDDTVGWDCRNVLDTRLETLKKINTDGTWSDNVYTLGNVTFTVTDGVITTSGTNDSSAIYFNLDTAIDTAKYEGRIFNGLPSTGSSQSFSFRISESTSSRIALQDFYDANGSAIQNNGSGKCLALRISGNVNTSGLTFKPMLCKSEYADLPFAPYHKPVSEWVIELTTDMLTGSQLKAVVADSSDFADFKTKVAAM